MPTLIAIIKILKLSLRVLIYLVQSFRKKTKYLKQVLKHSLIITAIFVILSTIHPRHEIIVFSSHSTLCTISYHLFICVSIIYIGYSIPNTCFYVQSMIVAFYNSRTFPLFSTIYLFFIKSVFKDISDSPIHRSSSKSQMPCRTALFLPVLHTKFIYPQKKR